MKDKHTYTLLLEWPAKQGDSTESYRSYSRNHTVSVPGKIHAVEMSSDSSFRGDASHFNPEELFLASLSSCHMLWYLHLCAVNGVVVSKYQDNPEGTMRINSSGSGRFTDVTLRPQIKISSDDMMEKAKSLHIEANAMCFIANSVNFDVKHTPSIEVSRNNKD